MNQSGHEKSTSTPPEKESDDSFGRKIFRAVKQVRDFTEQPLLSDGNQSINTAETESDQNLTMDSILSLDTWRHMLPAERHQFLDQFYSIREKFSMERDAQERCAKEELDLFRCTSAKSMFSSFFDRTAGSLSERVDPCLQLRHECRRCVEMMMVMIFSIFLQFMLVSLRRRRKRCLGTSLCRI